MPLEYDTGEFNPVEKQEFEEALRDTPEGNKLFKRMVLSTSMKQHKRCCEITRSFDSRISTVEDKVKAWKFQILGIISTCGVLVPVIMFLIIKYILK